MSGVKLQTIHFEGYEAISDLGSLAAGVVVPAGYRTLATSGHVGVDLNGVLASGLQEQIDIAFKVGESIAH